MQLKLLLLLFIIYYLLIYFQENNHTSRKQSYLRKHSLFSKKSITCKIQFSWCYYLEPLQFEAMDVYLGVTITSNRKGSVFTDSQIYKFNVLLNHSLLNVQNQSIAAVVKNAIFQKFLHDCNCIPS